MKTLVQKREDMIGMWAAENDLDIQVLTPYQYRIEGILDIFPVKGRYHWIGTENRGDIKERADLDALLTSFPDKTPYEKAIEETAALKQFKEWYLSLTKLPFSERTQAQIEMLGSVLRVMMGKEFESFNTLSDGDVESRVNGQEKLV